MFQRKSPWEIEWTKLEKKEQKFLSSREAQKESLLNQKLEEKVPARLQETLSKAFSKAFQVVFEKGTGVIEKTFKPEEMKKDYQIKEYANEVLQNKKSLKAFGKKAEATGYVNLALSGLTGAGMGILGVGIPDIPVFIGLVVKSIYEIALSYGYSYDTLEERRFVLMLIQGAVSYKEEMLEVNRKIDQFIKTESLPADYDETLQIDHTAAALSKELLYMKFLQGIPVVGVVGGICDAVYMKRITEYANQKYKKRFLLKQKKAGNV